MKFLAGAAVAALLFAAAGFAYSARPTRVQTQAAVTPKQLNALKARVAKLEKLTNALAGYTVTCLFKYAGLKRAGSPPNAGYVYSTDSNAATGEGLATALDLANSGEPVAFYVPQTTDTGCITAGSRIQERLNSVFHAK